MHSRKSIFTWATWVVTHNQIGSARSVALWVSMTFLRAVRLPNLRTAPFSKPYISVAGLLRQTHRWLREACNGPMLIYTQSTRWLFQHTSYIENDSASEKYQVLPMLAVGARQRLALIKICCKDITRIVSCVDQWISKIWFQGSWQCHKPFQALAFFSGRVRHKSKLMTKAATEMFERVSRLQFLPRLRNHGVVSYQLDLKVFEAQLTWNWLGCREHFFCSKTFRGCWHIEHHYNI